MKKAVLLLLARAAVCLLLAAGTLYFFIILPHDMALQKINSVASSVGEYQRALEGGATRIGALPDITEIKPQTPDSAHSYIQKLDSVLPDFNVSQALAPEAQKPVWSNRRIDSYNVLIKTNNFAENISSSYTDLKSTYNFLNHHRSALKALANLLEYNPSAETEGSAELVKGKLEEAGDAMAKIVSQLEPLSGDPDKTLAEAIADVKKIDVAREVLYQDVGGVKSTPNARRLYIATVTSVQRRILDNRQAFWTYEKKIILDMLKAASVKLLPINAGLQSLG